MTRARSIAAAVSGMWNWKSAILSSIGRSLLFFAVNLPAGLAAAVAAGQTEFAYRALAAGFYGSITERFSRAQPAWLGTGAALVVVPVVAHAMEYAVHRSAGTANAEEAVLASVSVSVATTWINVSAMRRKLLITGEGEQSLRRDLAELARLLVAAVAAPFARAGFFRGRAS